MQKDTIRKTFIFLMVFLPLQFAVVGLVGLRSSEPWPALVFPAFKSVWNSTEKISKIEPVFEIDTASGNYSIESKKFLEGLMLVQHRNFLANNFKDSTRMSEPVVQWLKKRINKLYPEIEDPKYLQIKWLEYTYALREGKGEKTNVQTVNVFEVQL